MITLSARDQSLRDRALPYLSLQERQKLDDFARVGRLPYHTMFVGLQNALMTKGLSYETVRHIPRVSELLDALEGDTRVLRKAKERAEALSSFRIDENTIPLG